MILSFDIVSKLKTGTVMWNKGFSWGCNTKIIYVIKFRTHGVKNFKKIDMSSKLATTSLFITSKGHMGFVDFLLDSVIEQTTVFEYESG